jgi:DNA topoisomerase VI subunit B
MTAASTLVRTTFTTSRLLEFCSEKELIAQTGTPVKDWPVYLLKELVDNALDACEEVGRAPEITIEVGDGKIVVADNGPGLPVDTVKRILDFSVRVSSREAYVSPTRGAQGNALKTVLAMPFALDGDVGRVVIEAHEVAHEITFRVDQVRQQPKLTHTCSASPVKIGTRVTVFWPGSPRSDLAAARSRFLQTGDDFTWINPHLTLKATWDGAEVINVKAIESAWPKWRPSEPTSAHWYTPDRLERLIAAYVGHDQDSGRERTVREFVSEFRGLSGSAKQKAILDHTRLSRATLSSLCQNDAIDRRKVEALLNAMQEHSNPVKPPLLGIIGSKHMQWRFLHAGAVMDSFRYAREVNLTDGLPSVVEVGFAWCPGQPRRLVTGVNWSPGISNPFRELGQHAVSLDALLAELHADRGEPITFVIHVASPRVEYRDRGKSSVNFGDESREDVNKSIANLVRQTSKTWTKQRKAEEREKRAIQNRWLRLSRSRRITIKDVAYDHMEEAYLAASANGTLPANARQIMYAARPTIQEETGQQLDDKYFTQTLLPTYVNEYEPDWDVVFDDRGHFTEPHTGRSIGLGTLAVRHYLANMHEPKLSGLTIQFPKVSTHGPNGRYGGVLFVEKEGFEPLWRRVQLADRFDLAIMSTKGMSVTAARMLVDTVCGKLKVPLFVLHDFDKTGFSILGMFTRSNHRYQYSNRAKVISLGLRIGDVEGLQAEQVFDDGSERQRAANLRKNGATEKEIKFLLHHRVELNAMTSDQLVAFVERKLRENGVKKVIPTKNTLDDLYRLHVEARILDASLAELKEKAAAEAARVEIPADLHDRVAAHLRENPPASWDEAVEQIVDEAIDDDGTEGGAS